MEITLFIVICIYLLSTTQGVFLQSPEPEVHDKVLDNNPDQIGIWKARFAVVDGVLKS